MNAKVDIKNGKYELVASGVFIADGTLPVSMTIHLEEEILNLILKFENDEKESKSIMKQPKLIDPTTLEIVFTNYNNIFGNFTKELWQVASINNGRKLYFSYDIIGLTNTLLKKINYSFYLGEAVTNG